MDGLSPQQILGIWEDGQSQSLVDRAVTMIAAACPDMTRHDVAELDIARRDALLFDLRKRLFGDTLRCFSECRQCSAGIEFSFTTGEIEGPGGGPGGNMNEGVRELSDGDVKIRFRLPNSTDLALAARHDDATARTLIVERCVMEVACGGTLLSDFELTEEAFEKMVLRMAEWAPLSDIVMDLTCPTCGYRYQAPLDIGSFLWAEIASEARRLLYEVHTLAGAYGWREADILDMSPLRRRLYMEMSIS